MTLFIPFFKLNDYIIIKLSNILVSAGRIDDLKRAEMDRPFLEKLIQELLPEEK